MKRITLLFTFCLLFGLGSLLAQNGNGNGNGNGQNNSTGNGNGNNGNGNGNGGNDGSGNIGNGNGNNGNGNGNGADNGNGNSQSNNVSIVFPQLVTLELHSATGTDVNFGLSTDGLEAGQELIIDEENSDLWLIYSCITTGAGNSRSIMVESSNIPSLPGLSLQVIASEHMGNGGGQVGDPTSIVTLSSTPTAIITGIGSAFTGGGNSDGHNLTYSLNYSGDFDALTVEGVNQVIEMTYTITD